MSKEFVKNVTSKNHVEAKKQFDGMIAKKLMEKLAVKKIEVARSFTIGTAPTNNQ